MAPVLVDLIRSLMMYVSVLYNELVGDTNVGNRLSTLASFNDKRAE